MSPSSGEGSASRIPIASRRYGFGRIRSGILEGHRPVVLITGEGGAGKSWLWAEVARSLSPSWSRLDVDMTSNLGASDFLLLVGDRFDLAGVSNLARTRLDVAKALRDEASDGRSWTLVVDDAHSASPEVWEEIRAFSNQIGRDGGFAAIVLIAQTELIGQLTARRFASVAGRITDHIHLPPLDFDECQALIRGETVRDRAQAQFRDLERIHRDARGNCGEILRLARRMAGDSGRGRSEMSHAISDAIGSRYPESEELNADTVPSPEVPGNEPFSRVIPETIGSHIAKVAATPRPSVTAGLSLVPSRPPLRLEEGLIEVGWQGEDPPSPARIRDAGSGIEAVESISEDGEHEGSVATTSDATRMDLVDAARPTTNSPIEEVAAEEWLDDPYAAIQAWSEWAKNRDKAAGAQSEWVKASEENDPEEAEVPGHDAAEAVVASTSSGGSKAGSGAGTFGPGATLRAESQHEYSPFSQLFGENRKSKQS